MIQIFKDQDKFATFIKKFNVTDEITGKRFRLRQYGMDEFCELSNQWKGSSSRIFDHVNVFKAPGNIIAVSQPYLKGEQVIKDIINDIDFVLHCNKYKYRITVYDDQTMNWWNDGCCVVIFEKPKFNPEPENKDSMLTINYVNKNGESSTVDAVVELVPQHTVREA